MKPNSLSIPPKCVIACISITHETLVDEDIFFFCRIIIRAVIQLFKITFFKSLSRNVDWDTILIWLFVQYDYDNHTKRLSVQIYCIVISQNLRLSKERETLYVNKFDAIFDISNITIPTVMEMTSLTMWNICLLWKREKYFNWWKMSAHVVNSTRSIAINKYYIHYLRIKERITC